MRRDEARDLLIDYADGTLPAERRAALDAVLAADAELREELDALREVEAAVKALPKIKAPNDFLARLNAAIDAEERAAAPAAEAAMRPATSPTPPAPVPPLAATPLPAPSGAPAPAPAAPAPPAAPASAPTAGGGNGARPGATHAAPAAGDVVTRARVLRGPPRAFAMAAMLVVGVAIGVLFQNLQSGRRLVERELSPPMAAAPESDARLKAASAGGAVAGPGTVAVAGRVLEGEAKRGWTGGGAPPGSEATVESAFDADSRAPVSAKGGVGFREGGRDLPDARGHGPEEFRKTPAGFLRGDADAATAGEAGQTFDGRMAQTVVDLAESDRVANEKSRAAAAAVAAQEAAPPAAAAAPEEAPFVSKYSAAQGAEAPPQAASATPARHAGARPPEGGGEAPPTVQVAPPAEPAPPKLGEAATRPAPAPAPAGAARAERRAPSAGPETGAGAASGGRERSGAEHRDEEERAPAPSKSDGSKLARGVPPPAPPPEKRADPPPARPPAVTVPPAAPAPSDAPQDDAVPLAGRAAPGAIAPEPRASEDKEKAEKARETENVAKSLEDEAAARRDANDAVAERALRAAAAAAAAEIEAQRSREQELLVALALAEAEHEAIMARGRATVVRLSGVDAGRAREQLEGVFAGNAVQNFALITSDELAFAGASGKDVGGAATSATTLPNAVAIVEGDAYQSLAVLDGVAGLGRVEWSGEGRQNRAAVSVVTRALENRIAQRSLDLERRRGERVAEDAEARERRVVAAREAALGAARDEVERQRRFEAAEAATLTAQAGPARQAGAGGGGAEATARRVVLVIEVHPGAGVPASRTATSEDAPPAQRR